MLISVVHVGKFPVNQRFPRKQSPSQHSEASTRFPPTALPRPIVPAQLNYPVGF